jgi:23S rRNA pseudouridine1911/1915/1917 synthase
MENLKIIYIDNHLIATVKPAGVPSQEDETGDVCIGDMVKAYIKEKFNKPGEVYLGVLHRLDRPVGGIMLFARTSKCAARLSEQFKNQEIHKTYLALLTGIPAQSERRLEHFLYKPGSVNKVKASPVPFPGAKKAILDYKILKTGNQAALVEINPLTGRQHQIRVQMAAIKCPIKGDLKYGSREPNPDKSICLFAHKIRFQHPVTRKEMEIVAPLPDDSWWKL